MNLPILLLSAVSAFSLDKFSLTPHLPDAKTDDMQPMTSLSLAAAKGEIESESFILTSDEELEGVDLVASDLTCKSAKIPASAIDLKVVAVVWKYPNAWMSIKQRRSADEHALIPCMLVHDEKLIVRDDKTLTNYLRGDYEGGVRYINMSTAECPERFNDDLHPVRDAKRFVPCSLQKGKYKQFWLTVKVPAAAAPGDYTGTIAIKQSNNRTIEQLSLRLTVHPFSLPYPRTHYDSSKRFVVSMMGGPDLERTFKSGGDLRQAEEKVFNIAKALAEHNVFDVCAGSAFSDLSDADLGIRCARLMQAAGLPLDNVFCGTAYTDLLGAKDEKGNFVQIEETDPARYEQDVRKYAEYAKMLVAGWRKVAPQAQVWAFGSDEGSLWTERRQFAYWHELQKAGGKLFVTCTEQVAPGAGWIIDGADISQRYGTSIPRLFQPSGARVFTYASPFLAPDQPSYTRWGKGVRFWKDNWDGLVDYVFYAGNNRWNETYLIGGDYREMGIVYPVQDGVVSTLAFEGYREGIDDIRYFTLLRLLSEKAMKATDSATAKLGREALVWFERRLLEGDKALPTLRGETAARIVLLQAKVGEWPTEVKAGAETFASAEKSPEAPFVDASGETAKRVRQQLERAEFFLKRLRRPSAEKAVEEALKLCDADKELDHKVRQEVLRMKFRTLLTPQVYLEEFASAQLDKAAAVYAQTANRKDALPASERQQMLLKLVSAYARSENPKRAVELANEILEDVTTGDAVRASLGASVAQALGRLGDAKGAVRQLTKALKLAGGRKLDPQSARLGFEQAQKANDAEAVRTFGTLYAATLNPTEQESEVRLVTETMKRYSKSAPAAPAEDSDLLDLDE